ncbi:MAG: tupA-like ATPgrasp family protein, partial [Sphingomonas bacterium]|nr:tupA-like ATPgrasp family protein [Sphingomonas bacterium]
RDHDRRMPHLIDKVAVKRFVAEALGPEWVTPTLWSGEELPAMPDWPCPFVVKSRHGCNQRRFVRHGGEDWRAIRRAAAGWMRSAYGHWLDEWGYRGVPRGVVVEPFIGDGTTLPVDYKFYVFHGRVAAVQVHLDREHEHRWMLFDPFWQRLSSANADPDPVPPTMLDRMTAGAETLARGFDFVRVDFYDTGETPRFGEMTFYPGSGLDPFDPPELDQALGRLWLDGTAR